MPPNVGHIMMGFAKTRVRIVVARVLVVLISRLIEVECRLGRWKVWRTCVVPPAVCSAALHPLLPAINVYSKNLSTASWIFAFNERMSSYVAPTLESEISHDDMRHSYGVRLHCLNASSHDQGPWVLRKLNRDAEIVIVESPKI